MKPAHVEEVAIPILQSLQPASNPDPHPQCLPLCPGEEKVQRTTRRNPEAHLHLPG